MGSLDTPAYLPLSFTRPFGLGHRSDLWQRRYGPAYLLLRLSVFGVPQCPFLPLPRMSSADCHYAFGSPCGSLTLCVQGRNGSPGVNPAAFDARLSDIRYSAL